MNAIAEALVLKHSYECDVETLFNAWLDADTVRQFMCPGTSSVAELRWDAKVGGEFLIDMRQGDTPNLHTGRFTDITRPNRIAFTWNSQHAGKDTLVTLDFAETETRGRTLLTLTHERLPTADAIGKHRGGWTSIMEKVAAAVPARG